MGMIIETEQPCYGNLIPALQYYLSKVTVLESVTLLQKGRFIDTFVKSTHRDFCIEGLMERPVTQAN